MVQFSRDHYLKSWLESQQKESYLNNLWSTKAGSVVQGG